MPVLRSATRATMGCGPSTIINPRKWRGRARSNAAGSDAGSDEDDDASSTRHGRSAAPPGADASAGLLEPGAGAAADGGGAGAAGAAAEDEEAARAAARLRLLAQNAPGPLLSHNYVPHIEVSASQQDFFRILDMKVESGPDLDPERESEKLREESRLAALLRDWERCSQRERWEQHRGANPGSRRERSNADQEMAGRVAGPVGFGRAVRGPGSGLVASVGSSGTAPAVRHPAQHPQHPLYPSTSHDAAWRRTNLAWVPEQRPVGTTASHSQPYPGRAVAAGGWLASPYQLYDGGLGQSWCAVPTSATTHAPQAGFRPYRADLGGSQPPGPYEEAQLYYGHGLAADPYYSQHYNHLGLRYGHAGLGQGLGHTARHQEQHLANSMVQLDKSGGTRTELA